MIAATRGSPGPREQRVEVLVFVSLGGDLRLQVDDVGLRSRADGGHLLLQLSDRVVLVGFLARPLGRVPEFVELRRNPLQEAVDEVEDDLVDALDGR